MQKLSFVALAGLLLTTVLTEQTGPTLPDEEVSRSSQAASGGPIYARLDLLTYNAFMRPAPVGWGDEVTCRAKRLADRLDDYDLVALNESFHRSAVDALSGALEEAFPHRILHRPEARAPRINGGLSLFSRFPIEAWESRPFARCVGDFNDCLARKGFLWALVRLSDDMKVNVIATHLNSGREAAARRVRASQLEEIRRFTDELDAAQSWPTILTGDLNIDGLRASADRHQAPSDSEYADAMGLLGNTCATCRSQGCSTRCEPYPVDAFRAHRGRWAHDADGTLAANTHNCTGDTLEPCRSPNDRDRWQTRSRIDYVMHFGTPKHRPRTEVEVLGADTRPFEDDSCGTRYLSDHKGVEATLEILRPPDLRADSDSARRSN